MRRRIVNRNARSEGGNWSRNGGCQLGTWQCWCSSEPLSCPGLIRGRLCVASDPCTRSAFTRLVAIHYAVAEQQTRPWSCLHSSPGFAGQTLALGPASHSHSGCEADPFGRSCRPVSARSKALFSVACVPHLALCRFAIDPLQLPKTREVACRVPPAEHHLMCIATNDL